MLSTIPRIFVKIADFGSITGAADELGLAKSAVSQSLKRLEEQIGVKLAIRTSRQLSLTPAGERYYRRCKEMLALSRMVRTEMEDYGATPAGPLVITAPHTMIGPIIAPALARLVSTYSNVTPTIIADDQRLDLIANGIDIAITVGDLPDSNLKVRRVGVLHEILCASPDLIANALANRAALTSTQVQSLPYIAHMREPNPVTYEFAGKTSKRVISAQFQPAMRCNSVDGIHSLVRLGLGAAILPDFTIFEDIEAGRLVRLLPNYQIGPKSINAIHGYDAMPPKSLLALIKLIGENLRQ